MSVLGCITARSSVIFSSILPHTFADNSLVVFSIELEANCILEEASFNSPLTVSKPEIVFSILSEACFICSSAGLIESVRDLIFSIRPLMESFDSTVINIAKTDNIMDVTVPAKEMIDVTCWLSDNRQVTMVIIIAINIMTTYIKCIFICPLSFNPSD